MYSFEGMKILVIGGSSGIGLATAQHAHRLGANVTIASRDRTKLEQAQALVGERCLILEVDSNDEAAMVCLFEAAGPLDHIFSCAGGHPRALVRDASVAQVRSGLEERFWGAFFICKYGAPHLRKGGSITFVSGVGVFKPGLSGESVVVAGAGAVDAFTRAMAKELAPIRVNAVSPGACDTPMTRHLCGDQWDAMSSAFAARLPVGRIGTPEDIAQGVMFLMGNTYVTGTTLHIEGGYLLV